RPDRGGASSGERSARHQEDHENGDPAVHDGKIPNPAKKLTHLSPAAKPVGGCPLAGARDRATGGLCASGCSWLAWSPSMCTSSFFAAERRCGTSCARSRSIIQVRK